MKVKEAIPYLKRRLLEIEDEYFAHRETLEILAYLLKVSPLNVYLYPEFEVSKAILDEILSQRLRRKPLPYILKRAFFYNRAFLIEEGVFIPRQETEILITAFLETSLREGFFLELGCGSGIISITLLLECLNLKGFAVDKNETALKLTKRNAEYYGVLNRLYLLKGNWLTPFKKIPFFNAIISNPPYISLEEWEKLDPEVRDFEPKEALVAGKRGTEYQEILLKRGHLYLKKGGFLLFEMGYNQAHIISKLASKYKWTYKIYKDLLNYERVILLWKEGENI